MICDYKSQCEAYIYQTNEKKCFLYKEQDTKVDFTGNFLEDIWQKSIARKCPLGSYCPVQSASVLYCEENKWDHDNDLNTPCQSCPSGVVCEQEG